MRVRATLHLSRHRTRAHRRIYFSGEIAGPSCALPQQNGYPYVRDHSVPRYIRVGGNHHLAVALIALLVTLGGSALAQLEQQTATRPAHHGKIKQRFGKIVDTDTPAGDGVFNPGTRDGAQSTALPDR